jgi:hypothetical protein
MWLPHQSRTDWRIALSLIAAIGSFACPRLACAETAPGAEIAVINATHAAPAQSADTNAQPAWLVQTLRLETVAYGIGVANANRCDHPIMATGLVLHELGSYDARIRPAIAQKFGLGTGFGVLGVVPGSGADRAGLRAGDEIVGVDATDLESFGRDAIAQQGQHERITRLTDLLDSRLRQGEVRVRIRNHGFERNATLSGAPACGGRVTYIADGPLNAWSDGDNVAVSAAMMRFARNNDELAFVVAHEMAHNLLHHAEQPGHPPTWMAMFGIGTQGIKRNEIAADEFAVDLLDRTSFNARGALPMIWRTAPMVLLDFGLTHPGASQRVAIITTRLTALASQRQLLNTWFDAAPALPNLALASNSALLPGLERLN